MLHFLVVPSRNKMIKFYNKHHTALDLLCSHNYSHQYC